MSCGCGKYNENKTPSILNMKQDLEWSINRAIQISNLREEDIQIYKTSNSYLGEYYEIEPINFLRENIVKIIKWQELEQKI